MASKESRQCPHFNIHSGVCGCPEFWVPAQRLQDDRGLSTLREVTNTRSDRNTAASQVGSSVNHIPLFSSTKTQPVTSAPSGPPKETCFFWYHGSCRRGDNCDRPHEAYTTWPIPPPPGFRHFQPCLLPLCPLRADLDATKKPQEYQRCGRTIGGQMDGAVFSRATTSGESASDSDNISNANTDATEVDEHTTMISCDHDVNLSAQLDLASQYSASNARGEKANQKGEWALHQETESHAFDGSDYVDLFHLPSLQSTTGMQEEPLLSISHPGTLGKRRQPHSSHPPNTNNKRVKLAESTAPDLSNVISILERPRIKSLWDIKLSNPGMNILHLEAESALVHIPSTQPLSVLTINKETASSILQPFDPPKGPRCTNISPLICFFFYHKGYCNPKRGRRCDYVHAIDTSQQTVSLPSGIDNHDPACSLQLCPARLQNLNRKRQESALITESRQPKTKFESPIPPDVSGASLHEKVDSSPCDRMTAMQSRFSKYVLDQPQSQLSDDGRSVEPKPLEQSVASTDFAVTVDDEKRTQGKKKTRKRGKGGKGQERANTAELLRLQMEEENSNLQGCSDHTKSCGVQQFLPSLHVKKELSRPTMPLLVDDSEKMRTKPRYRNKKSRRNERAQRSILDVVSESKYIRGSTVKAVQEWTVQDFPSSPRAPRTPDMQDAVRTVAQKDTNKASKMSQTIHQYPRGRWPLSIHPSDRHPGMIVTHEYSQASLGSSREERQSAIHKEQHARREAFHQRCEAEHEKGKVAREGTAHSEARVVSSNKTEVGTACTVEHRLPQGSQRLDWDTDLVRRLFGEID